MLSFGPLRTGSLLWRKAGERIVLTVVAKVTFALAPGESALADAPEEVAERENHWDDDPARSLHSPGDLAPLKRRADVVLVGHAFAPPGKPARSVLARLAVGTVDKVVEVFGPRTLTRSGEVRDGARWTRMPLRYERAAGGSGTWNPVGVSPDGPTDTFGQRPLPNLQPPGLSVRGAGDLIPPAGFGPLAAAWPSRQERLGGRAGTWTEASLADSPLPDDLDPLFFQVAPADQQLEELHGDEHLALDHLHPQHPRLATRLPGLRPRAFVDVPGAMTLELPLAADTLWIDTDRAICTLTWRGQLPLPRRDQPGRVVVAVEPPGRRLQWSGLRALLETTEPDTLSMRGAAEIAAPETFDPAEMTLEGRVDAAVRALPFTSPTGAEAPIATSMPAALDRPASSGPRSTIEVVVSEVPGGVPAWLVASAPAAAVSIEETPAQPVPRAPKLVPVPSAPPLLALLPTGLGALVAEGPPPERAAFDGTLAASNAAAGRGATYRALEKAPEKTLPRSPDKGLETAPAPLELIWFDPALASRMRGTPAWSALFEQKAKPAPPPRGAPPPPPPSPDDVERAARADFVSVLVRGAPLAVAEVEEALWGALQRGGALLPLSLVAGELALPLDTMALLQATVALATPLSAADKKLKEALDLAADLIDGDLVDAPEVADGLISRIREAWSRANRLLPATYLETHPERALLEQRRYQRREVLDATWIRAVLTVHAGDLPVPTYLPIALEKRLPLFKSFAARAVVEAIPQQDQYESHPLALRVVSLARVIRRNPLAR